MTEQKYDWRKGREFVRRNFDRDFSWMEYFYGDHLEPTSEELEYYNNFFQQWIRDNKDSSAQSYAFLAHPRLGKIISLVKLKQLDIFKRESWLGWDNYTVVMLDELKPERRSQAYSNPQYSLIKEIAQRILNGDKITSEELSKQYLEYPSGEKVSYDNIVWHQMLQWKGDVLALPYVGLIPLNEASIAIGSFLEEKVDCIKQRIDLLGEKIKPRR